MLVADDHEYELLRRSVCKQINNKDMSSDILTAVSPRQIASMRNCPQRRIIIVAHVAFNVPFGILLTGTGMRCLNFSSHPIQVLLVISN